MTKTIILGLNNNFSVRANRWLFVFAGLLFSLNGISHLISDSLKPYNLVLGIVFILFGLFYAIYGFFRFSTTSRFAPKIVLEDNLIALKKTFWKPAHTLKWPDIRSIEYGSYEIKFNLIDSSYLFSYSSGPDESIMIKKSIREFAHQKNIDVKGG